MSEFKDLDGKTVVAGDRIAYPGRLGSSMWMTKATVVSVDEVLDWRGTPFTSVVIDREIEEPAPTWYKPRKRAALTVLKNIVKLSSAA